MIWGDRLSEEETQDLVAKAQLGDVEARNILVESNMPLVEFIVSRYGRSSPTTPRADLVQEGSLGLIHAIRIYEPQRNKKFGSYAYLWVRAYVTRNGRHHTLSKEEHTCRLDDLPLEPSYCTPTIEDDLAGCAIIQRTKRIARKMKCAGRTRAVVLLLLKLRLFADAPATFAEISAKTGVSKQRVEQVEKRLHKHLRNFAHEVRAASLET